MFHRTLSLVVAAGLTAGAGAGITQPNEFETPDTALNPLFAYFGGVLNWGTMTSPATIHSGDSLEVWAELVDDIFNVSGFAVGTFGITPPDLQIDAAADTFSLTIQPPTNGQLSVSITLREDDNNDGLIDANNDDDQWESPTVMLEPDTAVYNIPLNTFTDSDADVGNNVQNFATTGRVAYFLVFETRESYPGGRITEPVSFLIDHVGLFAGPQALPETGDPADINGDGVVNINDVVAVILGWGPCPPAPAQCPADLDGNGVVNVDDLIAVVLGWSG